MPKLSRIYLDYQLDNISDLLLENAVSCGHVTLVKQWEVSHERSLKRENAPGWKELTCNAAQGRQWQKDLDAQKIDPTDDLQISSKSLCMNESET